MTNDTISAIHAMVSDYERFVKDQIAYAKELKKIKHMTFEHTIE